MQLYTMSNAQVSVTLTATQEGWKSEATYNLAPLEDVTNEAEYTKLDDAVRHVGIIVRNNSSAMQYHTESQKLIELINADRAMRETIKQHELDAAYE